MKFSDLNNIHDPRRYAPKWGVKWEIDEEGEVVAKGWEEEVFFSKEDAISHAVALGEGFDPTDGVRHFAAEAP